jgi:CBS domain-containing protein
VTCRLDDRVGDIREPIRSSRYRFGLVTSSGGVLLGRVRGSSLDCDSQLTAEEVMEPGPSTVRPDRSPEQIAKRLRDKGFKTAVVTTPEGVLIGVATCRDLEQACQ